MEDERTADQRAKQKEPVNAGSFCSGITASVDSLAAGNLRRDALKTVTTHGHHLLHPVRCWLALRWSDRISVWKHYHWTLWASTNVSTET